MRNNSPQRRQPSTLTGFWTGYYAYDLTDDAIMFTAWLSEESGRVTGSVLEENFSIDQAIDEYEADILGERHGLDVRFTKLAIVQPPEISSPLRYHGDVDADCCVISGVWFFDDPSDWTGTFMMTRISGDLTVRTTTQNISHANGDERDKD